MAHRLALALAAAVAASAPTPARLLVGHSGYDGSLDGSWKGWTNTAQLLLDEGHVLQVFRSGERQLITLERRSPAAGAQGAATVIDAVELEVPKAHQLSEPGYCEVKGKVTPLALAVVAKASDDDEYHPSVHAAWQVDLEAERMVALDPATVRCGNAAAGL